MEVIVRTKKKCCKEQKLKTSVVLLQNVKFCTSCMEVISYERGDPEKLPDEEVMAAKEEIKTLKKKKDKIKDLDLFDNA